MLNNLGYIPILLPLDNDNLTDILDKCDGFLVTGGSDVTPSCFNQENSGSHGCNVRLDDIDRTVVQYAAANHKPMIGICRGHQAINVFLGGTLIQDIGQSHENCRHNVITFKNRLLDFPKETVIVNSYHHQVCDKLAPGLIEIAKSEKEGYNEAFIHESLPILSFQWHPEKTPNDEISKIIYKAMKNLYK